MVFSSPPGNWSVSAVVEAQCWLWSQRGAEDSHEELWPHVNWRSSWSWAHLAPVSGLMLQAHFFLCVWFEPLSSQRCLASGAWVSGWALIIFPFNQEGKQQRVQPASFPCQIGRLHLPWNRYPGTPVSLGWQSVLSGLLPIRPARTGDLFFLWSDKSQHSSFQQVWPLRLPKNRCFSRLQHLCDSFLSPLWSEQNESTREELLLLSRFSRVQLCATP